MRPDRKLWLSILIIFAALLLGLLLFPFSSRWLRQYEFESKVRANVDPAKLQDWAGDLIRRYPPEGRFYLDLRGTNMPPGAAALKGYAPMVSIVVGEEKVPRVVLFGALGDPALLVGPTNFVSRNSETKLWKPGIYFRKAHH